MYESHFGLRRRPFRATPDTECYYPATRQEQALARLLQAIADDEGLILLAGAPGTGKTLLCHCLLERLGPDVTSAFLTNSHFNNRTGLLQAILYDLSLPYEGRSEQELRLSLTDFVLRTYGEGRRNLLIVDEAQHLTADLLEELRLLGNLEGSGGKAIQVVLVAQPGLLDQLKMPELAAFSQRLAVRVTLDVLSLNEAADYLLHQLRTAGGRPEAIVSDEALEILARSTLGVPRLLNQAAHQALSLAAGGATQVDAEVVLETLAAMGLEASETGADAETQEPASEQLLQESESIGEEEPATDPWLGLEKDDKLDRTDPGDAQEKTGRVHRLFASPRRPA